MIAIIYSGFLRTWEQVRQNHLDNLWRQGCFLHFHTDKKPVDNRKGKTLVPMCYHPLAEQLTSFPAALRTNQRPETSIGNTLNQWRNRKNAFKHAGIGCHVYVIARTDIEFSGPINLNIIPGKVYIPSGCDYGGVNDQFAFGDYDSMQVYCSLYDHYSKYFNEGLTFHPESYLHHHLVANGIEIIRIPQTNNIVRL